MKLSSRKEVKRMRTTTKMETEMKNVLESAEITLDDLEELEEMVTPGLGIGCNCGVII